MPKAYRSYLLRIWQTDEAGTGAWRASLEDPHTRQVIFFASLEMLTQYLDSLTEKRFQAVDCAGLSPDWPDSHARRRT